MDVIMDTFSYNLDIVNEFLRDRKPTEIISATLFCVASLILTIKYLVQIITNDRWKVHIFRGLTSLPLVREIKFKQIQKAELEIFKSVHGKTENLGYRCRLPSKSYSKEDVLKEALSYQPEWAVPWQDGAMSGAVYPSDQNLSDLLVEMTSGGTESIMLACLAYRNRAYKRGIKTPEMVIPSSAHAAFDKAGSMMNILVKKVSLDPETFKVNLDEMKKAITRNTCMLVGSAPQYPQGIIDDIVQLSKLGLLRDIPVHVDSCLGGFLVPFMSEAGFSLDEFDFRLPGVTSISCDTHKYGFAAKGSSVIMYSKSELRRHQYFLVPDWSGGIYASPTFAGSRSGAIIAACWSALMYHGREGYVKSTKRIVSTARMIANGIADIKGLRVLGEPKVSVVAFTSYVFDIYQLGEEMSKKVDGSPNWSLSSLQAPPALHICVTDLHTQPGVAERFLKDLASAADKLMKSPSNGSTGMAAIYGMCAKIPDRSLVASVVSSFLDACYATEAPQHQMKD